MSIYVFATNAPAHSEPFPRTQSVGHLTRAFVIIHKNLEVHEVVQEFVGVQSAAVFGGRKIFVLSVLHFLDELDFHKYGELI